LKQHRITSEGVRIPRAFKEERPRFQQAAAPNSLSPTSSTTAWGGKVGGVILGTNDPDQPKLVLRAEFNVTARDSSDREFLGTFEIDEKADGTR
jgi:hypothetical protein